MVIQEPLSLDPDLRHMTEKSGNLDLDGPTPKKFCNLLGTLEVQFGFVPIHFTFHLIMIHHDCFMSY